MTAQATSRLAYQQVEATLGRRQQEVLEALKRKPLQTNNELAAFLGWPINIITPRVKELRELSKVAQNGTRPCRITGRTAMVWEAIEERGQMHLL